MKSVSLNPATGSNATHDTGHTGNK